MCAHLPGKVEFFPLQKLSVSVCVCMHFLAGTAAAAAAAAACPYIIIPGFQYKFKLFFKFFILKIYIALNFFSDVYFFIKMIGSFICLCIFMFMYINEHKQKQLFFTQN